MPVRRLALIAALAALLAPGLWLRDPAPVRDFTFSVTPLGHPPTQAGPFTLAGWWALDGRDRRFGGLSALTVMDQGRFLAASDTGRFALFPVPQGPTGRARNTGRMERSSRPDTLPKTGVDIEALARDPSTGMLWAAYENGNRIARFSSDLRPQASRRIPEMRGWLKNSGPESLVRLADGRFLAIEESAGKTGGTAHRALLFPGDPVRDRPARRLTIERVESYRIVDAARLDQTIWLLLREVRWGVPPRFDTALARFPVSALKRDRIAPELVAQFGTAIPRDNYEGLAIEKRAGQPTRFWIVSDDNFSSFQSSWLLALDFRP